MATPRKKAKPAAAPKAAGTRKRRGVKLKPTDLVPSDTPIPVPEGELAALANLVQRDGGAVLASYREPLGGNALLLVALPVEKVAPTPYQREVSDPHVRRLTVAMDKTKRFLDPIIVVRTDEAGGAYLTPNGNHRLTALKELGSKTVIALLVPEHEVAYQILALNIEKAYNLREKAIEVVRLYRELARVSRRRGNVVRAGIRRAGVGHARVCVREEAAAIGRGLLPGAAQGGQLAKRDCWLAARRA